MKKIHLQGIGTRPAVRADELKPGDTIIYNYGATARVKAVEPVGKASTRVITISSDGREFSRIRRSATLCAVCI